VSTNDFQLRFRRCDSPALLGSIDDFDYLDRRSVTAFVSRSLVFSDGRLCDSNLDQHPTERLSSTHRADFTCREMAFNPIAEFVLENISEVSRHSS